MCDLIRSPSLEARRDEVSQNGGIKLRGPFRTQRPVHPLPRRQQKPSLGTLRRPQPGASQTRNQPLSPRQCAQSLPCPGTWGQCPGTRRRNGGWREGSEVGVVGGALLRSPPPHWGNEDELRELWLEVPFVRWGPHEERQGPLGWSPVRRGLGQEPPRSQVPWSSSRPAEKRPTNQGMQGGAGRVGKDGGRGGHLTGWYLSPGPLGRITWGTEWNPGCRSYWSVE